MTVEQAQKVGVSKQPSSEALTQHMYDFMQESVKQVSLLLRCNEHTDASSLFLFLAPPLQESGELSMLVQPAREKLTLFSQDPSLQGLAKLWLQLLTEPTETQVYGERSKSATKFSPTHA